MWKILPAIFALNAIADGQLVCLKALRGWKGTLYFPEMKNNAYNKPYITKGENTTKNCIFYLNTLNSVETKLTFGQIRLGEEEVTVKTLGRGEKEWKVLQTIHGVIPFWLDFSAHNTATLKVIVPKNAGSFFMDYEVVTCPQPQPTMKTIACTKDSYFKSFCIFECEDDYYPLKLVDKRLHAQCTKRLKGGKTEYYWKFSGRGSANGCVAKSKVFDTCFQGKKNKTCPYRFNDLLDLMGEKYKQPEREQRVSIAVAEDRMEVVRVMAALPGVGIGQIVLTPKQKICEKHCKVDSETGSYSPMCGSLNKKRQKKICLHCRFGSDKICQTMKVL